MTEYEFLSLVQGHVNLGGVILMNYFSILTAYLVAGYLAAHRLTQSMALFVTAAFVTSCAIFMYMLMRNGEALQAIFNQMHALAQAGRGLAWNPLASRPPNVDVLCYAALAVMAAGVIGGVYFFFQCRVHNRQAAT